MQIYNTGSVPVVGAWGDGLVLPGESIEVADDTSVSAPWSTDQGEAARAAEAFAKPQPSDPSPVVSDAVSGPTNASQGASVPASPSAPSAPTPVPAQQANPTQGGNA